jgi:hypothetical protein
MWKEVAGASVAVWGLGKAKWRSNTAYVRHLESTADGYVLVEMDNNDAFVADLEQLQSLHGAQQSRTPVRYWINNFQRFNGLPRGGLGDVSLVKRII